MITSTNLNLPLLARGKVRDVYELNDNLLLFVATDRISAYDVVMENGIPDKGKILTAMSVFWFNLLGNVCPNHLVGTELPNFVPDSVKAQGEVLKGRSLVVKKFKLFPLEAIVRGYLTGSAWSEYKKTGTVHGIKLPAGLEESAMLEQPLFTPSTKAEQGEHDENIHPDKAAEIVGKENAEKIAALAIKLYCEARDYAKTKGIIIADTKFEFGYTDDGTIVLVDEVLTPDSSRFWRADQYKVGTTPDSYDKQFLRNWLTEQGLKGQPGVSMPQEIVDQTAARYIEAYETLTGAKWSS
ncbi:hypothetical protein CANCADRAFT_105199 [Tortispora caseinolytica NRRL Y-17796]|uniref:Phosphoribosylaminoimidazole-succinocarboxamide synthase n=1 Tax=Tortispora caseinolytica NRRL Y-17796 TaxID=767744 RepID=A0A1E4TF08_9ASCO|nr:hypothetical protein CANCADRAFT_105199 [Tortispora caseinolytica NRRL Y-17796]